MMSGCYKHQGRFGVYIHWPFCLSKCPYCDFNSHVHDNIDQEAWEAAYIRAIRHYAQLVPGDNSVASIYFGGGTPSLMPSPTVEAIITAIQKGWGITNDCEITIEANPTSVESDKFAEFRMAGVNRVSLGVQALNDNDLKFLGRAHNTKEALQAIDIARKCFDRYSFDLIYARPEQKLEEWEIELREAISHADGHLSLYQLTIERSTPFYMDHAQGKFSMPEQDLAADFYHLTNDILEAEGMPAYEVSNHAREGCESAHNLIYWRYGDYIGIGPGAHGRPQIEGKKYATRDHSAPDIWLSKVMEGGSGAHPFDEISHHDRFIEALMMGIRLREGVSLKNIETVSGCKWQEMLDTEKLKTVIEQGWAVMDEDKHHLKPTREGTLRLNSIIPYILRD